MDYSTLLGHKVNAPIIEEPVIISQGSYDTHYESVRGKKINKCLKREEHYKDTENAINTFLEKGYRAVPHCISHTFSCALASFRTHLDIYDEIIKHKVFSKDEIYFRSLREGPAFTKDIKKRRMVNLQAIIALDDVELDEDYIDEEYMGYDSIIHERYLFPWSEEDTTEDYQYSLLEEGEYRDSMEVLEDYLSDLDVQSIETHLSPFDQYKGSKSTDNENFKKKIYLRDAWTDEQAGPYMAVRRVITTQPGTTRDTGVPDPYTLSKVRQINQIARWIHERKPHSANVPLYMMDKRIERIAKMDAYIHIDFKKFGLTFIRSHLNNLLRLCGREDLVMDTFVLNTDDGPIETKRGGVLGWFDPAISIVVSAIITNKLKQFRVNATHISFNDDVEVGISGKRAADLAVLLKPVLVQELESFGFLMSHRKTFVSREMIFLEQYYKFEDRDDDLDMRKLQLTVNSFARSLLDEIPWRAKIFYAEGAQYVKNKYVRDRCQDTIAPEFCNDEKNWDIRFGGWETLHNEDALDRCPNIYAQYNWFLAQDRYKNPKLTDSSSSVDLEKVYLSKLRRFYDRRSKEPDMDIITYDDKYIPGIYEQELLDDKLHVISKIALYQDEGGNETPPQSEGSFG